MKRYLYCLIILCCIALQPYAQRTPVVNLPAGLDEISGITISSAPRMLAFVHNDSGDTSRFFGIDQSGNLKCTFYFRGVSGKKGVSDCEDIASGKSDKGNDRYLYIGDIGDNGGKKKYITVYRVAEPDRFEEPVQAVTASPVFFKYPDGARDAETLMIDNIERLLYIVSKREDTVRVYTAPLVWKENDTVTLQFRTQLYFTGFRTGKWITSGDISWDGKQIVLKSLQKVYYWKRKDNESIWQTLQNPPAELPYQQEPQGEAICFDREGKGFYTVSEGEQQLVYYYILPSK